MQNYIWAKLRLLLLGQVSLFQNRIRQAFLRRFWKNLLVISLESGKLKKLPTQRAAEILITSNEQVHLNEITCD
jgi:hypothetical protein